MEKAVVLKKTRGHVKRVMAGDGTGHDFAHVERVVKNAKKIAKKEGGDLFVIELAALLHDIQDWKFHNADGKAGARKARQWLTKVGADKAVIDKIVYIIDNLSFKGGTNKVKMKTIEGKIVQDADRLDALGAIGIARAFAYGGYDGREIYNPQIKPRKYKNLKHYKQAKNTTINHFYEKLLLLKDRMNTHTGRKIADKRQQYIEGFLSQFFKEWNGKI